MTGFASGGVLSKRCHPTTPQAREAVEKVLWRIQEDIDFLCSGSEAISSVSEEALADLMIRTEWLKEIWMHGHRELNNPTSWGVTSTAPSILENFEETLTTQRRQLQYSPPPNPWEPNFTPSALSKRVSSVVTGAQPSGPGDVPWCLGDKQGMR